METDQYALEVPDMIEYIHHCDVMLYSVCRAFLSFGVVGRADHFFIHVAQ